MKAKRVLRIFYILILLVSTISCDQITKDIVRKKMEYHTQINLISKYVILTKVENTGAFLGLGNSIPRPLYLLLMIVLPLIAMGYALYFLIKKNTLSNIVIIGISFAIGGGIGNIIDRIIYVVFHTGVVNMADISVTIGFFMIMAEFYLNRNEIKILTTDK